MEDRVQQLEREVRWLRENVTLLKARLEALANSGLAGPPAQPDPVAAVSAEPSVASAQIGSFIPLVGRTLLVFGGAYLIRAISDRQLVPPGVGAGVGLLFATLWIGLAGREAGRGKTASAYFHAIAAALIGYPLIFETTTRLGLLSTPVAGAVLVAFTGLLLATAWRYQRVALAWLGGLGCLLTTGLLLRTADSSAPLLLVLLVLAGAALALEDLRGWSGLRWPVVLFLDLALVRHLNHLAHLDEGERTPSLGGAPLLVQGTALLYFAALALRTWRRDRAVGPFEAVQTALALALGLVAGGSSVAGAVALALAGGALVTAATMSKRAQRRPDAWFYSLAGMVLLLAGAPLLTRGPGLMFLWAGLGVAAAVVGRRTHPMMLWAFAVVLACAAAGAGGLLAVVRDGLLASPEEKWAKVSSETLAAAGLSALAWLATWVRAAEGERVRPRWLAGALLALSLSGIVGVAMTAGRIRVPSLLSDEALVALVRTVTIAFAAVALALARRLKGPVELGWVAWLAIGLGGLKLLAQDLRVGRPGTQFIAFLALGAALLLIPLLLKKASPGPAA